MKKRLLLSITTILLSLSTQISALCVHEEEILGMNLVSLREKTNVFIKTDDEKYLPIENFLINPLAKYFVQYSDISATHNNSSISDYNKKFIEYYGYPRMQRFMSESRTKFSNIGYQIVVIGKSVEGRVLYSVRPEILDSNKKTIVMFGRHHGDEGTANWIIEGFVSDYLKAGEAFHDQYQLILYPMVNPDGAENRTRYNKNNRDLNRSWSFELSRMYDEVKIIHEDLKSFINKTKNNIIALDMHGSFTEDFIYRVKKDYVSSGFFIHQQKFIDELSSYDKWQRGNFQLSNGHKKMARIVLINSYKFNALTHETPRDIKINNSRGRTKADLFKQGSAIFSSIIRLY